MTKLSEQGTLRNQFNSSILLDDLADKVTLGLQGEGSEYTLTVDESHRRSVQILMDNGDAQTLAGGLIGATSAEAARRRKEADTNGKKKRAEDARLQALLNQIALLEQEILDLQEQIEGLTAEIEELHAENDMLADIADALASGEIDAQEAMNDPRVAELVRRWEERRGTKFDPEPESADQILGAIISAQMLENADLIDDKNQRIGDMVSEIRVREVQVGELKVQVNELAGLDVSGPDEASYQAKAAEISTSVLGADALGSDERIDAKTEGTSRLSRDGQRLQATDTDADASENLGGFSGFGAASGGKLAESSANFSTQFETASANRINDPGSRAEPSANPILNASL